MRLKKYNLLLFLFVFLLSGAGFINQAHAQGKNTERLVAQIRKLYAETNERIAAGLEDKTSGLHHAAITIGGAKDGQSWRAVGVRNQTTEFYFNCEPNDPECPTDARRLIVKIIGSYQAGTSGVSRFEYLFNDKGELVFAYTSDAGGEGEKPVERRFYFVGRKLIRVIRDGKNIDGNFPRLDAEGATNAEAEARKLQNLFAMMFVED